MKRPPNYKQDRLDRRLAVALHYKPGQDSAPRISAKGYGYIADAIVELARQHGVPLRQDPELSGLLAAVELGEEIPPALFEAVAEVLAFVYRLNLQAQARTS